MRPYLQKKKKTNTKIGLVKWHKVKALISNPSQYNKNYLDVHACPSCYAGSVNRVIVEADLGKIYLKNN
jgi:hypothetical protein